MTLLLPLSRRPDIGDIDLLAELIKDIVFDGTAGIFQLSNVRTVSVQLSLQLTDYHLCNKQLHHTPRDTA